MTEIPSDAPLFHQLAPGDPVIRVSLRTPTKSSFPYDCMAGRYLVFCFFGSAGSAIGRAALAAVAREQRLFDDQFACFFGLSIDPEDETLDRVKERLPGIRFLWDFDLEASRAFGAVPTTKWGNEPLEFRPFWLVLDPSLHVLGKFPIIDDDPSQRAVFAFLNGLPDPARFAGFDIPPPILILPNVFEPRLCNHLIGLYDQNGGEETGVIRRGAAVLDPSFKRRRDYSIEDPALIKHIQDRIWRKIVPEISRVFFMNLTRMERYIVGCYSAEDGGHFRPHRDNNRGITEHRRFAVSVNLNGLFEGGEVSFPEYSRRGYKAPPGWAIVFPCNALHAVSQVTQGRRYAFLPFVYDEAGAKIRIENTRAKGSEPVVGQNETVLPAF